MKRSILLAACLFATIGLAQQHTEMNYVASTAQAQIDVIGKKGIVTLEVTNPNDQTYKDAPVCVKLPDLKKYKSVTVRLDGIEIPSQLDDLNSDDTFDELSFVVDLEPKASKTLVLTFEKKALPADRYESRVFTDMRLRVVKKGRTIDLRKENYRIDTISEVEDIHYSDVYPHGLCFEKTVAMAPTSMASASRSWSWTAACGTRPRYAIRQPSITMARTTSSSDRRPASALCVAGMIRRTTRTT